MAHSEHAKQYSRMPAVFSRAQDVIEGKLHCKDAEAAQDCIRKLGKEALKENGDWVLLHRERPLEMPHP
jgi:hypothetical protein